MKLETKDILLYVIIGLLAWKVLFSPTEEKEPQPITITLPESYGSTGTQILERAIPYPVYNNQTGEGFDVDQVWKKRYEEALDSLEKQRVYYEAIKINKYEETLIDNDTIEIKGYATTRGSLLDYSVDYRIKSLDFSYTPEIRVERPRLTMRPSLGIGVPTLIDNPLTIKAGLNFTNKKGWGFGVGYDTNQTIWAGLSYDIPIIK